MNKSNVDETLASLYLRLNGYFLAGYIVHREHGVKTELDVLGVRFPGYAEPEREVPCSQHLAIPQGHVDFLIAEVKGGNASVTFNTPFWRNPDSIRAVLRRFGAFSDEETERLTLRIPELLDSNKIAGRSTLPELDVLMPGDPVAQSAKLRFILFAVARPRCNRRGGPYIFGDDIFDFIWACFRPDRQRSLCDVNYDRRLWGSQFEQMVNYFKDPARTSAGDLEQLYRWYCAVD